MKLSPITLFVYNRLSHTRQTVESLKKNDLANNSELCIYSDGPKSVLDSAKVQDVRAYIRGIKGFKKITIIERERNLGLATSIINGVSEVLNTYGSIIVLEDDMVTSPFFLQYMNKALDLYENEERVISIHAYLNPMKAHFPNTFFLQYTGCWGWGTWPRGWHLFEPDAHKLLNDLVDRGLTKKFDMNGSYFFTKMLKDQINGKINSWAIRWQASALLHDKLSLFPGKSLIKNIGLDGSGSHCDRVDYFDVELANEPIIVEKQKVQESLDGRQELEHYFKETMYRIRKKMIITSLNSIMHKLKGSNSIK